MLPLKLFLPTCVFPPALTPPLSVFSSPTVARRPRDNSGGRLAPLTLALPGILTAAAAPPPTRMEPLTLVLVGPLNDEKGPVRGAAPPLAVVLKPGNPMEDEDDTLELSFVLVFGFGFELPPKPNGVALFESFVLSALM